VDHGIALYEQGDYKAAVKAFAAAHDERAEPEALFYLAKSHQRAGHFEEALDYFDRFLAQVPADDYDRAEAIRYREMIARHLAARDVQAAPFVPQAELAPHEPEPAIAIAPPREERNDPRAWRQTMWWVSGATILASYGLGWYAAEQHTDGWDRVANTAKYTWWAGIGGAVYFYYTGFLKDAPAESDRLRIEPTVAMDGLGVSLELGF